MKRWQKYIIAGIIALLVIAVTGCGGVSHKSPEKVTEELIQAYVGDKEKNVKDCYNQKDDTEEGLQSEITAMLKYFEAHDAKEVKIESCAAVTSSDDYTYVYIRYNLVLQDNQEYPCIGTYMVGKQDKDYYILAPSKITDDMRTQAAKDYAEFMTTDTYKEYTKAYDVFIKKNPGYEDKITTKIG